jgi:2-keto-4-pentenoate hydratase
MISEARKSELLSTAAFLLKARSTAEPVEDLAGAMLATSLEEAYFVQDAMAKSLQPEGIVDWKVGAPSPDATPLFAPMIGAWVGTDGCTFGDKRHRLRGLEAEIAFKMGKDLPIRSTPYSREEVIDAIESCHPAIEELESGLEIPATVARFTLFSDMQIHGGFIPGPAVADWQKIDFARESVALAVDGKIEVVRTASNTAGTDLLKLVQYLANEGSPRVGGLKKGGWITTGSWTGNTFAKVGSFVSVRFSTAGSVSLHFA